ncbi:AMN1 homolog [Paramuricea clavata]|uniref:AMN1 homolog n=1 Tax=Paramuricea clavata TaxID=317549 RepID=A0A6S7H461_PARCT|nr:AMN1 homolog [Paramuricea clavata]
MAAFKSHVVASLLNNCLENISKNLTVHEDLFEILPVDIKSELTKKLSMRGLLRDWHLQKLLHPKMRSLNLSSCEITDGGLAVIADRCKSLSKLDLNAENEPRIDITSNGITALSQSCKMLQTIYLRRCLTMNDDAVVAIATNCPYLTNLNLGGCHQLTDTSLFALAKESRNLSSVNISHTQVSDAGLCDLANGVCQQSLKEVHIAHCLGVTDVSVFELVEHCQRLNILILHNCPGITERSRDALETLQRRGSKQLSWTVY